MRYLSQTVLAATLVAAAAFPATVSAQESYEGGAPRNPGAEELGATTDTFLMEDGEAIYNAVCSGCHQPQGQGAVGAATYPPLALNPRLQGGQYPAWIVINGMGAMPAFDKWLSDGQIVEVVTYIQQNFANDFVDHPTAEMISDIRESAAADARATAGAREGNE
ncbi:c-type cytochrome [Roseicitreum antarcticum]|uniref:Cytochrome c, mono-and diheme variants n=1 Tax=Roseicitreum antarcticum TaxID=564137 RepID=A0A1H2VGM7_9RHOB|nr:cytochrome c [Roseicitreum antarcticum]SDW67019.1 Cytochrome c, mono-and diheme variants [Roseicitreum antarcticum]